MGGEEAHDLLGAKELKEQCQHQVNEAGNGHAEAGVGQRNILTGGGGETVGAQEGEGGAQESGDLPAGDQVEQQGAQACEQQGGGDIQTGQGGDQHGSAEHGEHMLQAQDQDLAGAQSLCVIDGFGLLFVSRHNTIPFSIMCVFFNRRKYTPF